MYVFSVQVSKLKASGVPIFPRGTCLKQNLVIFLLESPNPWANCQDQQAKTEQNLNPHEFYCQAGQTPAADPDVSKTSGDKLEMTPEPAQLVSNICSGLKEFTIVF